MNFLGETEDEHLSMFTNNAAIVWRYQNTDNGVFFLVAFEPNIAMYSMEENAEICSNVPDSDVSWYYRVMIYDGNDVDSQLSVAANGTYELNLHSDPNTWGDFFYGLIPEEIIDNMFAEEQ